MLLRAMGATFGLVAGALVALAVLYVGPDRQVICGSSNGPAAVAEEAYQGWGRGHVDGPSSTSCPVPAPVTWVLAVVALPVGVAGGIHLFRPRLTPEEPPGTVRRR